MNFPLALDVSSLWKNKLGTRGLCFAGHPLHGQREGKFTIKRIRNNNFHSVRHVDPIGGSIQSWSRHVFHRKGLFSSKLLTNTEGGFKIVSTANPKAYFPDPRMERNILGPMLPGYLSPAASPKKSRTAILSPRKLLSTTPVKQQKEEEIEPGMEGKNNYLIKN